jgi:hypothetical protein
MSKLLLKILKSSVLPASLMVASKLAGIAFAVAFYDLPLQLFHETGLFTVRLYMAEGTEAFIANSVASAILLITMNVGAFAFFFKQNLYLKTQGNPRTVLKLSKLNILKWITKDDGGFVGVFMWTVFLLATNTIIISETILSQITPPLGILAFLSSILFIWGLIRTFELETATIYPRNKEALS